MVRTRTAAVAGAVLILLALASCANGSNDSDASNGSNGGQAGGGQPSEQASGDTGGGAAGTVAVAKNHDFGRILVDADGRTLYVFLSDTGSKSTCYTDCASTWPALATDGSPDAGSGVDPSMLGTTERTDGSTQVTFGGRPLYTFSGDSAAGDTNGEGIGNVWYVVAPDGTPIEKSGGGGYSRY